MQATPPTACKSTVSGTISLPSPGYFSPFPHGTGPLSVAREYLALRGGPRGFTRNILRDTWEHRQELDQSSPTGLLPAVAQLSSCVRLTAEFVTPCRLRCADGWVPRPRYSNATGLSHCIGLGSSRFARHYSGSRYCFLLLRVLRCFNSPGYLYWPYVFRPE